MSLVTPPRTILSLVSHLRGPLCHLQSHLPLELRDVTLSHYYLTLGLRDVTWSHYVTLTVSHTPATPLTPPLRYSLLRYSATSRNVTP